MQWVLASPRFLPERWGVSFLSVHPFISSPEGLEAEVEESRRDLLDISSDPFSAGKAEGEGAAAVFS